MRELSELEDALDAEIIKNAKVIGITTTGAAKYNELLRGVNYEIVVAEEAAEVLEAHLITGIGPSTKHMILIGEQKLMRKTSSDHPSSTINSIS